MIDVFYRGTCEGLGRNRVEVVRNGVAQPLVHHVLHSPVGFTWGYDGSGPHELARCILIDYLDLKDESIFSSLPSNYHDFVRDHIATLPPHGTPCTWVISGSTIAAWLKEHASEK